MIIRSPAEDIVRLFPPDGARGIIEGLFGGGICADEIRLRCERPLSYVKGTECFYLDADGARCDVGDAYMVRAKEVRGVFRSVCENSVYAYIDEIRQGFVTIRGGHRVGFCGRAVCGADGRVENFRDINSINIRIARQVKGCADGVIQKICGSGVKSALIISPPGRGKTTLLRDIVRQISDSGIKVGVADDRSEISAMYHGVPQNDIGINTDVVENADKADAVQILQRTMSPSVIATDEVVTAAEVDALCRAAGTGISIIASVHGSGFDEVREKNALSPLFEGNVFDMLILIRDRDDAGLLTEVLEL